ncbi:MAG: anhydro-N-acetylmuramic acid kinase [Chloroflexota bacterium]
MKVLGMISGTSHDGIDVAVVDFRLEGDVLHGTLLHGDSVPYDPALREHLVRTLPPAELRYADVCELDTGIGKAFAAVAADAIARTEQVDLICSHGQTVFHWVEGAHALGTLQLGQAAWIAERTGVPVVADVRARDVAAGGHGAPLVSLMDVLLLGGVPGSPAALNLGGISNMTVLRHPGGPIAYDIGPSNALMDAAVREMTDGAQAYDAEGRIGASGAVDAALLADLLAEPYYALAAPRSTGKELFNADYVTAVRARHPSVSGPDLVRTLTALTAQTVADAVAQQGVDTLVCSGGGCANPTLMAELRARASGVDVRLTSEFGAPTDTKEAILFALIGWHTWHGLPGTVASCTGAREARVLGAVVPGASPLQLPAPVPLADAPRALRLEVAGA